VTNTDGHSLRVLGPAAAVTLATLGGVFYAFDSRNAGTQRSLLVIGGVHLALAIATIVWLLKRDDLKSRLALSRGDITIGALVAGVMYVLTLAAYGTFLGPPNVESAWVMRIYLQIGDPGTAQVVPIGFAVLVIAALEEIAWRGWAMWSLVERYGERRALLVSSVLYAAAHAPTAWLLSDPSAGLNPLVIVAAFGCGLVWGSIMLRFRRLTPAIAAHAIFSWAVVVFPLYQH